MGRTWEPGAWARISALPPTGRGVCELQVVPPFPGYCEAAGHEAAHAAAVLVSRAETRSARTPNLAAYFSPKREQNRPASGMPTCPSLSSAVANTRPSRVRSQPCPRPPVTRPCAGLPQSCLCLCTDDHRPAEHHLDQPLPASHPARHSVLLSGIG